MLARRMIATAFQRDGRADLVLDVPAPGERSPSRGNGVAVGGGERSVDAGARTPRLLHHLVHQEVYPIGSPLLPNRPPRVNPFTGLQWIRIFGNVHGHLLLLKSPPALLMGHLGKLAWSYSRARPATCAAKTGLSRQRSAEEKEQTVFSIYQSFVEFE